MMIEFFSLILIALVPLVLWLLMMGDE